MKACLNCGDLLVGGFEGCLDDYYCEKCDCVTCYDGDVVIGFWEDVIIWRYCLRICNEINI